MKVCNFSFIKTGIITVKMIVIIVSTNARCIPSVVTELKITHTFCNTITHMLQYKNCINRGYRMCNLLSYLVHFDSGGWLAGCSAVAMASL